MSAGSLSFRTTSPEGAGRRRRDRDALRSARAARPRRGRPRGDVAPPGSSSSVASTTSTASPTSMPPRSSRPQAGMRSPTAVLGDVATAAAEVGIEAGSPEAVRAGAAPRRGRAWSIGCAASLRGRGSPSSSPARWSSGPGSAAGCRRRSSSPTSSPTRRTHAASRPAPGSRCGTSRSGSSACSIRSCLLPRTCSSTRCPTPTPLHARSTRCVMSLAAIPTYLIARRLLPPGLSLLAALLAVALPSLAYTGTLMSENAFYPAFLLAAWALLRALDEPTLRRQLVLLAACGVVTLVRVQGIAVVLGALTAPLLLRLVARRPLRPWLPFFGIVAGGAVLVVGAQLARGGSISSLFGAYQVVGKESYDVVDVLKYLFWHLAELDLYVGVIPFAAFLLLAARIRTLEPRVQAFVAATVALTTWTLIVVAAFASRFAGAIVERNMFMVAPLLLIGLLVWIDRGRAEAAHLRSRRRLRRGGAAGTDSVRALPAAEGALRHADDRAALERPRPCRAATTRRGGAGRLHRRRRPLRPRPTPLRARPARGGAGLLRDRDPADPGRPAWDGAGSSGGALRGDSDGSTRLDRQGRGGRQRRRALDGQDESLHGAHERVLQPLESARSTRSEGRCRAACPRPPSGSTPRAGRSGASTMEVWSRRATCSPTARSHWTATRSPPTSCSGSPCTGSAARSSRRRP